MARYRRKVTEVEAGQFFPPGHLIPPGVELDGDRYFVTTAHNQRVYLEGGEYIVPEPDGRGYYPVKPDIFLNTYERVGEPPPLAGLADQMAVAEVRRLSGEANSP